MYNFENEMYITITGLNFYFHKKPFKIGGLLTLKKDRENTYDTEAIAVEMPMLGKVGYVANSPHTVALGCMSAGRIYNEIPDECAAAVQFMTDTKVIAKVLPNKKVKAVVEMELVDIVI